MKKLAILIAACASLASAQIGRSLDWPTFGNDPQRTGWEKAEVRFTKDELPKTFQLLWKQKVDSKFKGPHKLTPPVIVGTLVGSRGFKELAFTADADDSIYVFDADLDRVYWQKHLGYTADQPKASPTAACPGATAMPALLPMQFRRPAPRPPAAGGGIAAPARPARPYVNPAFAVRAVYVITSDGLLHRLNIDSGNEMGQPSAVLPPNSNVSTLNVTDGTLYVTTSHGCGGAPNAVWAIDISNPEVDALPKVTSWKSEAGEFSGFGGPVIGTEGDIFVQTAAALTALSPKVLDVKAKYAAPLGSVTPVVFKYKDQEMIVAAARDGRLLLLDAKSLNAPIAESAPQAGLWGGLATWAEEDGARWVLATVGGSKGSVIAYKLEEEGGKPTLKPAWTSREFMRPVPPVIASGVVFALSNGEAKSHAVLYALDAETGKEIWSSGSQATAAGSMTGLTVANGRVYFGTQDGTLWAFGVPLEW